MHDKTKAAPTVEVFTLEAEHYLYKGLGSDFNINVSDILAMEEDRVNVYEDEKVIGQAELERYDAKFEIKNQDCDQSFSDIINLLMCPALDVVIKDIKQKHLGLSGAMLSMAKAIRGKTTLVTRPRHIPNRQKLGREGIQTYYTARMFAMYGKMSFDGCRDVHELKFCTCVGKMYDV